MTNTQLTDFDSSAFDDIASHCPFCGVPEPEPGIRGVNSIACMACTENIHFYTPTVAYVYGDLCNFNIWSYLPVANTWDREADPVFIDPVPRKAYIPAKHSELDVAYADLPEGEQQIIKAVATSASIDERTNLSNIPVKELCSERVNALSPFRRQQHELSSTKIQQLIAALPRPTVFTVHSVYTNDEKEVRTTLTSAETGTTQAALTGL